MVKLTSKLSPLRKVLFGDFLFSNWLIFNMDNLIKMLKIDFSEWTHTLNSREFQMPETILSESKPSTVVSSQKKGKYVLIIGSLKSLILLTKHGNCTAGSVCRKSNSFTNFISRR